MCYLLFMNCMVYLSAVRNKSGFEEKVLISCNAGLVSRSIIQSRGFFREKGCYI